MPKYVRIDNTDLRILDTLQRSGRLSNARLASEVGLSESACFQRVKRLEKAGVITGYQVVINSRLLGPSIAVIAAVELESGKPADYKKFEALVAAVPEIVECNLVTGQYDYVLKVHARDLDNYTQIMETLVRDHGRVNQYYSHAVMRSVKQDPMPTSHLLVRPGVD
jgi:Lrp/AsnC family transcriptional regulator, regulator of ectoine-degradation genes